jgi:chromosome segregation ATPase
MHFLRIDLSITDIVVLSTMAVILGFVVQFVLVSRRKLQAMIEESKRRTLLTGLDGPYFEEPLKPKWTGARQMFSPGGISTTAALNSYKKAAPATDFAIDSVTLNELKHTLRQQQKSLDQLLARMDKLDVQEGRGLAQTAATALALEERETELQRTKQQLSAAQKVAGRVTEVYHEFDRMQQKMAELEESANKVTELELELEDAQQAYVQVKKEAARHQEKLREVANERDQLQQQLAETEDRLTETDRRQQQLQKRVQLLEDINAELNHMSDANKKLKSELRRIAELESMLSLVSDERDLLLKKRLS